MKNSLSGVKDLLLIAKFILNLRPEPRITVSEWADKNRYLDSKASAEPGLYKTSRTPYVRQIADDLSVTSIIRYVVVMKGAQVGLTELGNNWTGYIIDCAPGPMLSVQPTISMMERNSKMRIAPMIENSPTLREKIKSPRQRDSGNTIGQKEFPGGVLIMTGAESASALRSMPARYVMADECDAYPGDVDGEGSPMSLMEKRTSTYSNKKFLKISTPTLQGASVIEAEFLLTDQRYFHVPCPHCGGLQYLKFPRLKWEGKDYDNVAYICEHCEEPIPERFKGEMLANGKWIATVPENASTYTVGYHVSALYSPPGWKSWAEIAEEWVKAQGDDNKLKSFYNTILGETWKVKTDAPEWESLQQRAIDYPLNRPFKNVAIITAGVDVQADRLEVEIVGWMEGRTSQHIDYRVLLGDTMKPEVWRELDKIANERFLRQDGTYMGIRMIAIDSGYISATVYKWAKKYGFGRVVPIKGQEKLQQYFSPPRAVDVTKHGKKVGKQKVWHIGVSFIKTETYSFFRQTIDPETNYVPEGFCYFPKRDTHYFRGLTAEVIQITKNKKNGFFKYEWVKKYERNEPLDCRVYARAAAAIVGIDNWKPERWERERDYSLTHDSQEPIPEIEKKAEETKFEIKEITSEQEKHIEDIATPTQITKQLKQPRLKKQSFWGR
ncbi:phage terminase large subunit family protein [Terrimonas sp. NA20]|uniref:Phage terminase large subunit family protein n=1 Tax=Terrimonas ginsenosidimutans TaxID=2908004 RepID=A0ABS9KRE3_9BACT|nr:phage terminase large subunit family protein [Terrimonas ginsenosidimutans]MCG2614886.1 phage terminase large subunit family protein [Terrimonas ginsenosidimutans]